MSNISKITHSRLYHLSQTHLKVLDKQLPNNKLREKNSNNRTSLNDRTTKKLLRTFSQEAISTKHDNVLLRTFSQEAITTIDLFEADHYQRTNFKPIKRLLKKGNI